jgi:hypothetical protein
MVNGTRTGWSCANGCKYLLDKGVVGAAGWRTPGGWGDWCPAGSAVQGAACIRYNVN